MKKVLTIIFLLQILLLLSCATDAEDKEWSAAEVCPETGTNAYGMPNRGTFTDERDGQVYRYTTIGGQVWMAQNLNYDGGNNACLYEEDNCAESGRLYYSCSAECPAGWRLPSYDEWLSLLAEMDSAETNVLKLKSTDGWLPLNPGENANGTDECGLNIKPWNLESEFNGYSMIYLNSSISSSHFRQIWYLSFESTKKGYTLLTDECGRLHAYARCVKD